MNDSGQLYVTGTSEPDQYAIDNYSGRQFASDEVMPVEEYFRVSGYFGSYEPHMFAAAPKLLEELQNLVDLAEGAMRAANRDGGEYDIAELLKAPRAAIAAANGESQR
jgi:hypothetical protein